MEPEKVLGDNQRKGVSNQKGVGRELQGLMIYKSPPPTKAYNSKKLQKINIKSEHISGETKFYGPVLM